jgi:hypothetical protein
MYPLSYQATLPADDVIWSKQPRPISGPNPIPPRNEPHLSNSTALSYQATLPADDVIWSKQPCPVSGPNPIPAPHNEPHISNSTIDIPHSMGPLPASEANCTYGGKCEDNVRLASDLPITIKLPN